MFSKTVFSPLSLRLRRSASLLSSSACDVGVGEGSLNLFIIVDEFLNWSKRWRFQAYLAPLAGDGLLLFADSIGVAEGPTGGFCLSACLSAVSFKDGGGDRFSTLGESGGDPAPFALLLLVLLLLDMGLLLLGPKPALAKFNIY